jgi:glycosyltransferase involved in cell wall biosynthesis
MRVGLYIHNYALTDGGGYTFQREILNAASVLSSQSQHHFFILNYSNQNQAEATVLPGLDLINIEFSPRHSFQNIFHRLKVFTEKQSALSALDFTAQEHHIEFIWFITPAYEQTNIPYIATVWDLQHRLQPWFPEAGNLVEWQGRETYISTYLKRAVYVIVPNQDGKQEVHLFYQIPENRILCLPHPTPKLRSISPDDERNTLAKYGLQSGFLFYPAQYWAHKNHANFLFALKVLKESYNLMPVAVFVGSDKGNLSYLKNLASDLGVQSQIHYLGFVTDTELAAFYKNARALVYLSFFGPENLPPLEAFSVGCPVIAARISGASEQFGDAALLVNPTQPDEIALSIKLLLDDPQQRETLASRGLERAKQATALGYTRQVFSVLDEFERTRRAWES